MRIIDLTNQRFGKILVTALTDIREKGQAVWQCKCDCGAEFRVRGELLRIGKTKSCGCLRRELGVVLGKASTKHGQSGHRRAERKLSTPEYMCWANMLSRCQNPKHDAFQHYGARGIMVCPRWSAFENFLADMGPRPSPKHSIDRIDVESNYEPSNCRWATAKEQCRNMRSNRWIEAFGERKTLAEWLELKGLRRETFYQRLRRGLTEEQALSPERARPGRKRAV